jgi:hypothetical protein
MPESLGAVGAAFLSSPHGVSELLVGLLMAGVFLSFWARPAPRRHEEPGWGERRHG